MKIKRTIHFLAGHCSRFFLIRGHAAALLLFPYVILSKVARSGFSRLGFKRNRRPDGIQPMEVSRIFSIVCHDILMPLKFLHMLAKNLLEADKSLQEEPPHREALQDVVYTSLYLKVLSSNILHWLKLQSGLSAPETQAPCSLREYLEEPLGMLQLMASYKNIQIRNEMQDICISICDAEPLRIMVYNLVLNAVHAMEKGMVIIRGKQLKRGFFIEIADQGYGMTLRQIHAVFSDIPAAAGKERTGLGYLIIRDILQITRGRFGICSKLDAGTRIRLFFPALSACFVPSFPAGE